MTNYESIGPIVVSYLAIKIYNYNVTVTYLHSTSMCTTYHYILRGFYKGS
jgi:hypothetical protein